MEASENNTLNLLLYHGWQGWWFERDPAEATIAKIQHQGRPQIRIFNVELQRRSINQVFQDTQVPHEIDFLSIDVDGVDWHLWNALTYTRARVACIEYNADLGIDASLTVKYREPFDRMQLHPQYHGASLQALTHLAHKKSMKLVGTDSSGTNAFFIQKDLPLEEVSVKQAFHLNNRCHWRGMIDRFQEQFGFQTVNGNGELT